MTQTTAARLESIDGSRRNYLNENRAGIVVFDLLIVSIPISALINDWVAGFARSPSCHETHSARDSKTRFKFFFSFSSIEIPSIRYRRKKRRSQMLLVHPTSLALRGDYKAKRSPEKQQRPRGCSHEEWSDSNTSSTAARMMDLIVGSFDIPVRRVRNKTSHRKNKTKKEEKAIADRFIDENSIQVFCSAAIKARALWRWRSPLMPRLSRRPVQAGPTANSAFVFVFRDRFSPLRSLNIRRISISLDDCGWLASRGLGRANDNVHRSYPASNFWQFREEKNDRQHPPIDSAPKLVVSLLINPHKAFLRSIGFHIIRAWMDSGSWKSFQIAG